MVQRTVRKPTSVPKRKTRGTPNAIIGISASEDDSIMKVLANLITNYPGAMRLMLNINTGDAEVLIKTDHKISRDGLAYINSKFPSLTISPAIP